MAKRSEVLQGTEKEFMEIFHQLCYSRSSWQVWADVMSAIACSLSNAVDKTPGRYEAREKEYEQCIKRLGSVELPAKLMGVIVMALENNPEQDFLGDMYMRLELGNHWKGQFFTPYCVCQCMAEITIGPGVETEIDDKGYLSISDPACGAGATLIAAANTFRRRGIQYQRDVLFVGQDIDRVVGQMCYIQLSLLGCPGYIAIANTITNPVCGSAIAPYEKEDQEFWYTPFYFRNVWIGRRIREAIGLNNIVQDKEQQQITVKNEVGKGYFFFFENEQEDFYMSENNNNLTEDFAEDIADEMEEDITEDKIEGYSSEDDENADNIEAGKNDTDEKNTSYETGEEKLKAEEDEILSSVDNQYKEVAKAQFGMVFDELIKKSKEDESFNSKVLLEHKSFARCMKYCGNKAMGLRNPSDKEKEDARNGSPIVTPVSSDLLFTWIYEYYDLDDKAEVEKEKANKKSSKPNWWPAKDTKKKEKTVPKPKKEEPKTEDKPKSNRGKKEMEGQFSLFDMF